MKEPWIQAAVSDDIVQAGYVIVLTYFTNFCEVGVITQNLVNKLMPILRNIFFKYTDGHENNNVSTLYVGTNIWIQDFLSIG